MTNIAPPRPTMDSLVAGILDEYRDRLQRGERPSIEEYVGRYPEHETLLRNILATFELLDFSLNGTNGTGEAPLVEALGDFRIIREVGRGGMGVVYEAEQLSLNRRAYRLLIPGAPFSRLAAIENAIRENGVPGKATILHTRSAHCMRPRLKVYCGQSEPNIEAVEEENFL